MSTIPYWARSRSSSHFMNYEVFPPGSRVLVVSYSPFRGLKGTIRIVNAIPHPDIDEPFCFYQIELEGTQLKEPIWFQHDEIEITSPHRGTLS